MFVDSHLEMKCFSLQLVVSPRDHVEPLLISQKKLSLLVVVFGLCRVSLSSATVHPATQMKI